LLTARSGIDETMEGFSHAPTDYWQLFPRELLMRGRPAQLAGSTPGGQRRLAAVGTLAAGCQDQEPAHAITGAAASVGAADTPLCRPGAGDD